MALGYLRLGLLSKAIATLEQGVAKAPQAWILWELLGNSYSDAERYREAEKAYQGGLLQENCDPHVIHLNRAIAFERAGNLKQAWSAIQKVDSTRLSRMADEVRIRVSCALGNKRRALRIAHNLCRQPIPVENRDSRRESSILTTCARVLKAAPKARRKARGLAYQAIGLNPANNEALALIRELDNNRAIGASLFKLLIHGIWNEPLGKAKTPPGFFRSCQVRAKNQATAIRYARQFFPPRVRSSLLVEEASNLPSHDIDLDGVYFLSSLMFYRRRRKSSFRRRQRPR
jgi:tetratricopeptide (TPR) repeat protein